MTATVHPSSSKGVDRPVRAFASRTPKWQRFQADMIQPTSDTGAASVESKEKELYTYQRQYSHVYSHRLLALKDRCWKQLQNETNDDSDESGIVTVNRILELQESQLSRVVGTLVKETSDPKEEPWHSQSTCRPSDELYLEDESGRVLLNLDKSKGKGNDRRQVYQYCTGVVVGIEGTVDDRGVLHVDRIVPPALPPASTTQASAVVEPSQPSGHDPHLLLVSSLLCGDPQVSSLPREMLVGYLQGQFTDAAAKVARIIVAGSGPGANMDGLKEFDMWAGLQVTGPSGSLEIPMDILPSAKDPTTRNWPQRPLHSSLLPHCSKNNNKVTVTPNPYEARHATQLVLGTDGLSVRDLQQVILKPSSENKASAEDTDGSTPQRLTELEALEQTLRWGHLCPTGPDRVGMIPLDDPMVIDKAMPHIYFCGNCEEGFATKLIDGEGEGEKTRLICIPKFSDTGEVVLVNLKTLDVEVLRFKVDDDDESQEQQQQD